MFRQRVSDRDILGSIERSLMNITDVLGQIKRRVDKMAVDQATFDAALSDFLNDLQAGLAAIQAKLDAAGASVDLSAELQQITDAKAAFDAQVAADTTTPPA
jgi:hypothetical protein